MHWRQLRFAYNALMGNEILPLVESISSSEDDLQSTYQEYDICSAKRYNDECASATEMYQCSRASKPSVTKELFKTFEEDSAIVKSPAGRISTSNRMCMHPIPTCTFDQSFLNSVHAGKCSFLFNATTASGRNYYVGYFNPPKSILTGLNYCCMLGKKPAEFESFAKYNELKNIPLIRSILNSGKWSSVELTYDNGDGSDNWCRSHTRVPLELLKSKYYQLPESTPRSQIVLTEKITELGSLDINIPHYFFCE